MTARNALLQSPESRIYKDAQPTSAIREAERELVSLRDQFLRKGKKKIGVRESLRAIAFSSCTLKILSNRAPD